MTRTLHALRPSLHALRPSLHALRPRLHALRRWPVIAVIVVLLVGGGSAAWALTRSSGSTTPSTQIVTAAIRTVQQTVSASGTIEPAKSGSLDFDASGRVTSVKVKVGDRVDKGQTLATIGTATLAAEESAAAANLTAAADRVAADTDSTTLASDQAALTAARSQLASAKASLKAARLRSTITGTVTAVNLTVGQQVSANASASSDAASSDASSSSAQVAVQSTKSFLVDATVDDTEVSEVKAGQQVAITPDGAISPVTGTVQSVSKVPTSSSGVVSFPVVVRVTGHPSGVYAGASATLSITTKKVPHVLEIPTLAVTYSGSTATVQVEDNGSTTTRTIKVGQTYGLEIQVLSGIVAGDKVVVTLPTFGRAFVRGTTGGTGGETRDGFGEGLTNGGGGLFGGGGSTTGGSGSGGFGNGGFGNGGFGNGGFGNGGFGGGK